MDILKKIVDAKNGNLPLNDIVYNRLLKDILTGELPEGTKLTESAVCKKYETSRTPVREAIMQLKLIGLIEFIPNRGAFVRGIPEDNKKDLLEMRADCEVRAVEWGVSRITEDEERQLHNIFHHMEFYTERNDIPKMIDINTAFHMIIYDSAHNEMLHSALVEYRQLVRYCCPTNYFASGYMDDVFKEHKMIYDAYIKRDPEAGAQAMKNHMEKSIARAHQNMMF